MFELQELSCVLQSGLVIQIPGEDQHPSSLPNLEKYFSSRTSIGILLAIPRKRTQANVAYSYSNREDNTRFKAENLSVFDENRYLNEGESSVPREIEVARKNLVLITDTESLEGWETLRIAELEKKDGQLTLNPNYIPPSLRVLPGSYLETLSNRVKAGLYSKIVALEEKRKSILTQEFASPGDVRTLSFLGAITTHLPLYTHLSEQSATPEKLFEILVQTAGMLSSFSHGYSYSMLSLPVYDKLDGGKCFRTLERIIFEMLDVAEKQTSDFAIPLELVKGERSLWKTTIRSSVLQNCRAFFEYILLFNTMKID